MLQDFLETVQETIISTREARLVRDEIKRKKQLQEHQQDNQRTVGWVDPLAQTFLIDDEGGVFLTSIDIFFSTKDYTSYGTN